MIDVIFFLFYRFFLLPLALFFLALAKPLLKGKLKQMVEERSTPQWPSLWARPIWIHASSGEIEYAKPVIHILKENFPEIPILVTYFSPSALKLLQGPSDIDYILPLPFDSQRKMREFIRRIQPLAVLFSRTDVWPELAFQLKLEKIPALLFAATLTENSGRAQGLGKYIARFSFNQLSEIFCVSEADQRVFKTLGVTTDVQVLGDTRYDQVLYRLRHPRPHKENFLQASRPLLVLGSTWPEDEKQLLPCLGKILGAEDQVIWAPHEIGPSHLQDLEKSWGQMGLTWTRFSELKAPWTSQILLVDQVGILAELYQLGQIAFVGGSFKDKVHSVMEPLAAGLPVVVGPHHHNNREALHFQLSYLENSPLTLVSSAQDSEELTSLFQGLRAYLEGKPQAKASIKERLRAQAGASEKVASWGPMLAEIKRHQPR